MSLAVERLQPTGAADGVVAAVLAADGETLEASVCDTAATHVCIPFIMPQRVKRRWSRPRAVERALLTADAPVELESRKEGDKALQ